MSIVEHVLDLQDNRRRQAVVAAVHGHGPGRERLAALFRRPARAGGAWFEHLPDRRWWRELAPDRKSARGRLPCANGHLRKPGAWLGAHPGPRWRDFNRPAAPVLDRRRRGDMAAAPRRASVGG